MTPNARLSIPVLLALSAVVAAPAGAGTFSRTELTSSTTTIGAKQLQEINANCAAPLQLISAAVTPANTRGTFIVSQEGILVDGQRIRVDGVHPGPSGYSATLYNSLDASDVANIEILCGVPNPGFEARTVAGTMLVTTKSRARAVNQCGAGFTATWGGYYAPTLAVRGSGPHFGTPPYYFQEIPDGTYTGPVGWETDVSNPGTSDQPLLSFSVCWQLPDAVTLVASVPLAPNAHQFVGLAASDQQSILGGGMYGGSEGHWRGTARWTVGLGVNYSRAGWKFDYAEDVPGTAAAGLALQPKAGEIPARSGGVYGSFVQDLRPAGSTAPATPVRVAIISIPSETAAPATSIVQVVEYYNAARDHWFMTAIPKEISDLDGGMHPGWTRTGQTFKAYATGSGGPLGRLPFCRYYGLPEYGLDSHFYTGSILECLEIIAKFRGAWQLESGEVFQVQLPNVQTGACPAGTVAVYRTWNGRADSNHRYMTDPAIRAQMLAAGHVAEGYGPNGVAFCAAA